MSNIDQIAENIKKMIASCNDDMKILTPHTIKHNSKKTTSPTPRYLIINTDEDVSCTRNNSLNLANVRGPCGRSSCGTPREMQSYIEKQVEEDNREININDIIGPCGSTSCDFAKKIRDFIRQEGDFSEHAAFKSLSEPCDCLGQIKKALSEKCDPTHCKSCMNILDSEDLNSHRNTKNDVYYCTIEYNKHFPPVKTATSTNISLKRSKCRYDGSIGLKTKSSDPVISCSESLYSMRKYVKTNAGIGPKCNDAYCPKNDNEENVLSPADSNVVINFDDIYNAKNGDVAELVKDLIVLGLENKKKKKILDNCCCDCVCSIFSSGKTL